MSEKQAIRAGLDDLETDKQLREDEQIDFDNAMFAAHIGDYFEQAFIEEIIDQESDRRAILAGVDPIRCQRYTRPEHLIAIEQLDPPITFEERRDLSLYFCMEDDLNYFSRQDQIDDAWRDRRPPRGAFSSR
jgi:hypothetical protein